MSDAKESMDNASKMAHDVSDAAQEAASLVIQMLTGLFPLWNTKRINDEMKVKYDEMGDPISSNDEIIGKDIPHVIIMPLIFKLNQNDIPYVIAQPDDDARLTGMTHVKFLAKSESEVEQCIDEASEEDNSRYFIESQDPGKLVAVAGDGGDHEVTTVGGIDTESIWSVSRELQQKHVFHEISATADGKASVCVLSIDEDKAMEAINQIGIMKHLPEYQSVMEADRKRGEAMLAVQKITKGIDPITDKPGLKPVTIYDVADPSHRIVCTTGGAKEVVGKEEKDAIAPTNAEYTKKLQIKAANMVMPAVAYEKDFREMMNGLEQKMREYDARVNDLRATLDPDRQKLRAIEGQLDKLLDKHYELERELGEHIKDGRDDKFTPEQLRAGREVEDGRELTLAEGLTVTSMARTLGERENNKSLSVETVKDLKLLDNHEIQAIEDLNNERIRLGLKIKEKEKSIEEQIKELEMPELGKQAEEVQKIYDATYITDFTKNHTLASIKTEVEYDEQSGTERMSCSIESAEFQFSEYDDRSDKQVQLEQAIAEYQKEVSEYTVDKHIEQPLRAEDELTKEENVQQVESKVNYLEAEVDNTPSGNEEPVLSTDFE